MHYLIELAFRKDGNAHIIVSDNGMGIDIAKAQGIIEGSGDQKGHIGTGNVYGRICLYYRKAGMAFRSIPLFRNEVELILEGEMLIPEKDALKSASDAD
ncbi:MAG: hypothetical protein SPJ34_04850 [Candidatus Ornithospirochaeta sp.]|nr:hypothetical protein [Candidatus Ornithospirochaeta sp.]